MSDKNYTLEFLKEQLERTNYWLSFAEAKNGALVAVNIAMMTIIVEVLSKEQKLCVILLSWFIISIIVCLISFFPNLNTHSDNANVQENNEDLNLLFYADIAKLCEDDYKKQIKDKYKLEDEISNNYLVSHYISEIHINSCIANRKFVLFKKAILLDLLGFALCIVVFIAVCTGYVSF